MRRLPLLVWLPLLVAGGCSRGSSTPQAVVAADPLASMQLDGGKRWAADAHTRQSIAAMTAAMQSAARDPSPAGTTALGNQLRELGHQLIAGCTMTGPAHDALHVYLGVLLPDFHRMSGSDAEAAKLARSEAAAVLARFDHYFQ